ncbi:MAG: hypothetical protein OJJ55_06575 [Rhodococcus sp.]|nr:hypothetical protein [Rhodococcus sp. (in: high G+C Gram-positive bacteria)]
MILDAELRTVFPNGGHAESYWFDDSFVTEFFDSEDNPIGYWDAPEVLTESGGIDKTALASFHDANVAIYAEDGGGPLDAERAA